MERKSKNKEEQPEEVKKVAEVVEPRTEQKLKYKKLGKGSLRLNGQIIKPNQIFYAFPNQIPTAFMDTIECLDLDELKKSELTVYDNIDNPADEFEIVKKSTGWYNVVNKATGKVENEKGLRKPDAEELIQSLNP